MRESTRTEVTDGSCCCPDVPPPEPPCFCTAEEWAAIIYQGEFPAVMEFKGALGDYVVEATLTGTATYGGGPGGWLGFMLSGTSQYGYPVTAWGELRCYGDPEHGFTAHFHVAQIPGGIEYYSTVYEGEGVPAEIYGQPRRGVVTIHGMDCSPFCYKATIPSKYSQGGEPYGVAVLTVGDCPEDSSGGGGPAAPCGECEAVAMTYAATLSGVTAVGGCTNCAAFEGPHTLELLAECAWAGVNFEACDPVNFVAPPLLQFNAETAFPVSLSGKWNLFYHYGPTYDDVAIYECEPEDFECLGTSTFDRVWPPGGTGLDCQFPPTATVEAVP